MHSEKKCNTCWKAEDNQDKDLTLEQFFLALCHLGVITVTSNKKLSHTG